MVAAFRGRATQELGICSDRWALDLAGDEGAKLADGWLPHFPHMTLWMGLRTRLFDDEVVRAIRLGTRQIVILGAGLDTRAARFAQPGVRFFEVDLPASQTDKLERLAALTDYPDSGALYVGCDFENEDFLDRLTARGYMRTAPTLFLWEGVVYYLDEAVVRATCARIAKHCPEARLVFDYVLEGIGRGQGLSDGDQALRDCIGDLGEPIRFGINDPSPLLFDAGFVHVRTLNFDQLSMSYHNSYDRSRLFRFQRVALAANGALGSPWG